MTFSCVHFLCICHVIWALVISCVSANQSFVAPLAAISYLDRKAYVQEGDINIGVILYISDFKENRCNNQVRTSSAPLEFSESIKFAVDAVNRNQTLLPNVTLGFVILNDCNNNNYALAKALSFLPRVNPALYNEDNYIYPACHRWNSTNSCPMSSYDVVAVISPSSSQPTVMVSQLMTTYRIPVLGSTATSDVLSDKTQHPYFLRVVPPDRYQVSAMLRFTADQGWSYISVLYVQGPYGEKAFDTIKSTSPTFGICLATSHRLDDNTDYDLVVNDLLSYPRARVVILFIYSVQAKSVFTSVRNLNATGHFIFLGSDGLSSNFRTSYVGFEKVVKGMFSFNYYMSVIQDLYEYIRDINATESKNPWLKPSIEIISKCSFAEDTCDLQQDILMNVSFYQMTSLYIDSVFAIAHGVHDLISRFCPGAEGARARTCVKKGGLLFDFIRNTSFYGYNGHVEFDSSGDVRGSYKISQIVLATPKLPFINMTLLSVGPEPQIIGVYSLETQTIQYSNTKITWDHLHQEEMVVPPELRPAAWRSIPESICSRPCSDSEYRMQREPACCWECRACRDNERLVDNNTGCRACEKYTWPDDGDPTTCLDIPMTYHTIKDTLPLFLLCLGFTALICATVVLISYIHFRDFKVIKAASRELSILQMTAIFVGYATVILFQMAPTVEICGALYFTFCLSFTWLYAPLLVKVVRIYRIFQSGKTAHRRPKFVSPQSQLLLTAALISVQIFICVYIYSVYRPTARKTQPVLTEKFVELSCDMTLPGLTSFLSYNLVLVCLCAVFAFKTRKLPDNFNESRFISMCVSTTLIIWLASITTYFTASRDFIRSMVLSVTLLLNHTVAVVFLYAPKIYAAVCLPPEDFVTTRAQPGGTMFHDDWRRSNRVAPFTTTTSAAPRKV